MASYWLKLDKIPEERYHDMIMGPMFDCLKNSGILLDYSKSSKPRVGFEDISTDFFLQAGGSINFYRTTVPTVGPADVGMLDRNTLITIKGIPKESNITEDMVSQALRKFDRLLLENGISSGRITDEGHSIKGACYIATAVYGSYDCLEVWVLRRYRDNNLLSTWYGRLFVKIYYAFGPTVVKVFGNSKVFNFYWKAKLDKMVSHLQERGFDNTPYND